MKKFAALLFVALLLHCTSADGDAAPIDEEKVYDNYRLPTAVTPENYKLEVITHLNDTEGFLFKGHVWITVRE